MTKDKNDAVLEKYYTVRDPLTLSDTPIFILINNYTASAAEILACYLMKKSGEKGSKMPPIITVGSQSFGKASVQEVIALDNECALKLTTALYYFADNTTIQGHGIEPDFCVERCTPQSEQVQWFLKNYGRESCLENCITTSKKEKEKKNQEKGENKSWNERVKQMLQTDNQVRECILLINTLDMLETVCPKNTKTRAEALCILRKLHVSHEPLIIQEEK
jgi:carboxyl-terminal processing protease